MAGNRGIIVKVGERGPAYEMVRITGYKQFPSANIVMWVMNGRALNKHAAREALRLVQRALRNTVWIRKWFRPPRGSHCSHGLPGKWNIRSRHLWTWKKNERLESFEKKIKNNSIIRYIFFFFKILLDRKYSRTFAINFIFNIGNIVTFTFNVIKTFRIIVYSHCLSILYFRRKWNNVKSGCRNQHKIR